MSKRKNGGIIGPDNKTTLSIKPSGVFTTDEVYAMREKAKPKVSTERLSRKDSWEEPERDPYFNQVCISTGDIGYTDWLMRDKSSNNWGDFVTPNEYYREQSPTYFGPRYAHWCTSFHDDGYLYVEDPTGKLAFGTGSFTIEFWVKLSRQDATQHYIMGRGNTAGVGTGTGWTVFINSAYKIGFYDGVGNVTGTATTALNRDTWYHVAIARSLNFNETKIYINGVAEATFAATGNFSDTNQAMYIGRDRVGTSATFFGGKITDIRIKKGVQQYSANFTIPTSPLDMAGSAYSLSIPTYNNGVNQFTQPQGFTIERYGSLARIIDSPFIDNSTLLQGHGATSICVPYSGHYTKIEDRKPSNTSLQFGTGPFTVECWLYVSNAGGGGITGKTETTGTGWSLYANSNSLVFVNGATALTSATIKNMYQGWHHLCAVRENTSANGFKMYIDGALVYTGTCSTDFTATGPLQLFTTKDNGVNLRGNISCLKLSKTARYTTGSTTNGTIAFTPDLDTVGTTDSNTSLLLATGLANSNIAQWVNEGTSRTALWRRSNEPRYGQHHPTNRGRGGSYYNYADTYTNITATTTQGDFDFGTGDFSIELWVNPRYEFYSGYTNESWVVFDTRRYFNDTGICLEFVSHSRGFLVTSNNTPILSENSVDITKYQWVHLCVQRTSGKLALYVNGRMSREVLFNSTVASPLSKLAIGNGSKDVRNWRSFPAWFSDLRILKGSGAYSNGTNNPDYISVPTKVLLTLNNALLKDYSGRNNNVSWPRGDYATGGNWDVYSCNFSPYLPTSPWDLSKEIIGDTSNTDGQFNETSNFTGDGSRQENSCITRMSGPWTIECFQYSQQTNPNAVDSVWSPVYTASTTGHEGWMIRNHYGAGANSYGNVSFAFYTEHDGAVQWLNSTDGTITTFQGHAWNHIAICYDPNKQNKVALFVNGVRKAVRATAFNPGRKTYNTYTVSSGAPNAGVRLSTTARYDNDSATCTVPTQGYVYDQYTLFSAKQYNPFPDRSMNTLIWSYGVTPSTDVKKFGTASMKFTNRDTTLTNRLAYSYNYWGCKIMDTNQQDFTMEFWAAVWDAASGGQSIAAHRVVHHFQNNFLVRVNSAGYWQFGLGDSSTDSQIVTTDAIAATKTSGTMDHIAYVRRGGNYYCYVNGVEKARIFAANPGTYTNGSLSATDPFNVRYDNVTSVKFGATYDDTEAKRWCGFIQDIRMTLASRYTTKVINGVSTMVHEGTNTPALPTKLLPTW
jgi:hypothetical protein